jgi:hypothetical protein
MCESHFHKAKGAEALLENTKHSRCRLLCLTSEKWSSIVILYLHASSRRALVGRHVAEYVAMLELLANDAIGDNFGEAGGVAKLL